MSVFMRIARSAITAILLALIWLVAFRIADLFTVFKTYSSVWFLPAGVTLAIVLAAPGWLKLVPLAAHLSLAVPQVGQVFDVGVVSSLDVLLHSIRIYLIYGGAGLFLIRKVRIAVPLRAWHDVQWFIGVGLVAASLATLTGIAQGLLLGEIDADGAIALVEPWFIGDSLGAILVPPMMVPVVMLALKRPLGAWRWPNPRSFATQAVVLILASFLGAASPALGMDLWYVVLPPVLLFALRGGLEQAATSAFLICVITPAMSVIATGGADVADLPALLLTTVIAALLVGAAITERQEAASRLEALVHQRTAELASAYELQRHLVRSLGHDLRQPVEAINLTVAAVDANNNAEAQKVALARIRQLGALASNLLGSILAYARLDTGEVRANPAPAPLPELIEQLRAVYEPLALRRGQSLIWPENAPTIVSDRDLLFQVLSNQLDNAVRLTSEGGKIEMRIKQLPEATEITILDDLAATAKPMSKPGGLGLRIISQAAELLGAEVIDEPNRKGICLPTKR
jgi:signal transduction histidine kinase